MILLLDLNKELNCKFKNGSMEAENDNRVVQDATNFSFIDFTCFQTLRKITDLFHNLR